MGGQRPKRVPVGKRYVKYRKKAEECLEKDDITKAAKTMAPLASLLTGSQAVGAVIMASAYGYLEYKKSGSVESAAYEGGKTLILNMMASKIAGDAMSEAGVTNQYVKTAASYAVQEGLEYLAKKGAEVAEKSTEVVEAS